MTYLDYSPSRDAQLEAIDERRALSEMRDPVWLTHEEEYLDERAIIARENAPLPPPRGMGLAQIGNGLFCGVGKRKTGGRR